MAEIFIRGNADSTNVIINESMASQMGKEGKLAALSLQEDYKVTVIRYY